jgi:hypothetical protein
VMELERRALKTVAPVDVLAGRLDMTLRHDRTAELHEIGNPSLIVGTRDDATVPFYQSEDLHKAVAGFASRKIVSLAHAYVTRSAGGVAAPLSPPSRRLAIRKFPIFASAAIAAVVACLLVTVFPWSWFATKPSSSESQVAVQSLPRNLEMKAEFPAAPKQVETTAAPLAANPTLKVTDLLIRKAPLANQIDTQEVADLLKRGRELIAAGDIPAARMVLKQVAEAGNAAAALELGATYDPIVLEERGVSMRGTPTVAIAPDIPMARAWYQRARELGSAEASERLVRLSGADR